MRYRPAMKSRLRRSLLVGIGVLYAISIPWYRDAGEAPAIWFGLPDWVAVAIGCYALAAVLNSLAWFATEVPDREDSPDPAHPVRPARPGGDS